MFKKGEKMAVLHINQNEFEQVVLKNDLVVVVDFYADWCGPCQMLGPVLEEISENNPALVIVKINVDDNMELCSKYHITSIPNVMIFKKGEVIDKFVGFQSKAKVEAILAKYTK